MEMLGLCKYRDYSNHVMSYLAVPTRACCLPSVIERCCKAGNRFLQHTNAFLADELRNPATMQRTRAPGLIRNLNC